MKLTLPMSLSLHYGTAYRYNERLFNSTKLFLNERLKNDGVLFLKDALIALGFRVKNIPIDDLRKAWIYRDKRSKVKMKFKEVTIRNGKNSYYTEFMVTFDVPDN